MIKMNIKEVEKVLNWLQENFTDTFQYCCVKENNHIELIVKIYDEYNGWESKQMFFNNQGFLMPNYAKEKEIKEEIKRLQEELKKLQKTIDK